MAAGAKIGEGAARAVKWVARFAERAAATARAPAAASLVFSTAACSRHLQPASTPQYHLLGKLVLGLVQATWFNPMRMHISVNIAPRHREGRVRSKDPRLSCKIAWANLEIGNRLTVSTKGGGRTEPAGRLSKVRQLGLASTPRSVTGTPTRSRERHTVRSRCDTCSQLGLGRIVALYHRSSTSSQIR